MLSLLQTLLSKLMHRMEGKILQVMAEDMYLLLQQ